MVDGVREATAELRAAARALRVRCEEMARLADAIVMACDAADGLSTYDGVATVCADAMQPAVDAASGEAGNAVRDIRVLDQLVAGVWEAAGDLG